jgi:hypothetical protein
MDCLPRDVTDDERQRFKEAFFATLGARGDLRHCQCEKPRACVGGLPAERCLQCNKPPKPVDMAELTKQIGQFMGNRLFRRGSDPSNEWCLSCDKHVRSHYGGTEYRCYPKELGNGRT